MDLMVCGSRGRGRPTSALLGSVSARLVAHGHCPVLVVPPSVGAYPPGPLGLTSAAANL
jgi:nucleotide-binding universal stress UspA family protein